MRNSWWRPAILALVPPAAVTLLALLPVEISTGSAALAYVLAVVVSAAMGGRRAGLVASVVSFFPLNYFFTHPKGTLAVGKTVDLVALGVYLLVSSLVGTLLSTVISHRSRAERREQEALLLHSLATRLLSGERIELVLEAFARAVMEHFDLASCEITTEVTKRIVVGRKTDGAESPNVETVHMTADGRRVGSISVTLADPNARLGPGEREVFQTFAGQMGLALARIALASEAQAARLAAEANKVRAALFSSVTHDLRTPLASITASVTSLLDPDVTFSPQDRRELLETIHQEAVRLNRLVTNFLEISRHQVGGLAITSPGAIDEVIDSVLARMQRALSHHQVRLIIGEGLPDLPMDMVQIDQLLTNLLENAIKFSPRGSEIRLSASRWQNTIRVRVTDQGLGVPPEQREQVFEPFVGDRQGNGAGAGLGLSIAKAIVSSHGGKIWLEGSPGGGTAVTFDLPLDR
jgi:two-component system sensor histidine kinase KdpD